MQLPSKGKHSPPFSALLYYGCFYLGFYGKRGLHGHYVCTESRWPSITCYLGKQSWAPRAAVIFLPQAGDSAEELWLWVTALSSHSAPRSEHCVQHSSWICLLSLGWANTELSNRAEAVPSAHSPLLSNTNGTAHFPHQFFSRETAFPGTAANKSEPDICLEWLLQDVAPEQCLQQMCLFSIADGTLMGWGKVVGR